MKLRCFVARILFVRSTPARCILRYFLIVKRYVLRNYYPSGQIGSINVRNISADFSETAINGSSHIPRRAPPLRRDIKSRASFGFVQIEG